MSGRYRREPLSCCARTQPRYGGAFSALTLLSCSVSPPPSPCPPDMAYLEGGPFLRGAPPSELYLSPLALSLGFVPLPPEWAFVDPFCMDNFEYPNIPGVFPRSLISYSDATALCHSQGKRLCKDLEFDFACGGPDGWHQPYGELEESGRCNDYAVSQVGSIAWLAPSGAFGECANPEGIYDLEGNLSEWVAPDDDAPPEEDALGERLVRGGTMWWAIYGSGCHARHSHPDPGPTHQDDGFRCCRSLLTSEPGPDATHGRGTP